MITLDRTLLLAIVLAAMCASTTSSAAGTFFKKKRSAALAQKVEQSPQVPTPAPQPQPPAPEPMPQPAPTPALQPIAGSVDQVVSLDTLLVGGQRVRLSGVRSEGGDTAGLARWLASTGNQVSCEPLGERYRCLNASGADVAQIILFNGAARADTDASAEYRQVEAQARAAGKGLWAQR